MRPFQALRGNLTAAEGKLQTRGVGRAHQWGRGGAPPAGPQWYAPPAGFPAFAGARAPLRGLRGGGVGEGRQGREGLRNNSYILLISMCVCVYVYIYICLYICHMQQKIENFQSGVISYNSFKSDAGKGVKEALNKGVTFAAV